MLPDSRDSGLAQMLYFSASLRTKTKRYFKERTAMSRNILYVLLAIGAALAVGYWFGRTTTVAAAGTNGKVFEIRTYTAEPGKLDALHSRFRDHTLEIFKKHREEQRGGVFFFRGAERIIDI